MTPSHVHRYQRRSTPTGMAFTVLFSLIAGLVILSCFIWGFLVPYLRKKYFPPKPSLTKFNQKLLSSGSSITLIIPPSRNARSARNSGRPSPDLTFYNPRLQTPFPRMPTEHESIMLPAITPPGNISPMANAGQSLFTPIRDRNPSCPEPALPKSYTLPRVRARSEQAKSSVPGKDFGDAKEYILALPEPLRLKSKTHSGHLKASSTLGQLPYSSRLYTSADRHLHPKKLFEQLKNQDSRDSCCSSTSMKVKEARPWSPAENSEPISAAHRSQSLSEGLADQITLPQDFNDMRSIHTCTSSCSTDGEDDTTAHNESVMAMHRLRTYRSLVGAPPPEPLTRAGTLTRPKTPVAKMRDLYDRTASESKTTQTTVSRNDTMSTFLRTVGDSFDRQSSKTSKSSSPTKMLVEPFTTSSLSLLPTPLRIQRHETRSFSSSSRHNSIFKEEFDEDTSTNLQLYESAHSITEEDAKKSLTTKTSVTGGRPRPAPLTLAASARRPPQHQSSVDATSSGGRISMSHRKPHATSMQASSIYSRDTRGFSIAQTPASPEFSGLVNYRPPFSPYVPSTIDDNSESNRVAESEIVRARNLPTHAAKQKVEDWDIDIEALNFDTSPSPSLKRALSSLGPYGDSTLANSEPEYDHRHSVISTEINPSEARLSTIAGPPLRMSVSSQSPTPRVHSPAPRGADWF